jgi:hypothetical protein
VHRLQQDRAQVFLSDSNRSVSPERLPLNGPQRQVRQERSRQAKVHPVRKDRLRQEVKGSVRHFAQPKDRDNISPGQLRAKAAINSDPVKVRVAISNARDRDNRVIVLQQAARRALADLLVPVDLREDFRNVRVALVADPGARIRPQLAASVPAQRAYPRPSRASRCMRASLHRAAGVRPWKSATPRASASCTQSEPALVRARVRLPNLWRRSNVSRAS